MDLKKITSFVYEHKGPFTGLAIFIVGMTGAVIVHQFYQQKMNKKISDEIYQLRSALEQSEKKQGGNVLQLSTQIYSIKKAKDPALFDQELSDFIKYFLDQKKLNSLHFLAGIELAYFLVQYGQNKKALDLLSHINSQSNMKNWLGEALFIQLGSLLMEQKNYTQAVYIFSLLIAKEKGPFYLEALFKSAVCYEALGEFEKAKNAYALIKNSAGIYEQRAVNYERLFKVKQKIGLMK